MTPLPMPPFSVQAKWVGADLEVAWSPSTDSVTAGYAVNLSHDGGATWQTVSSWLTGRTTSSTLIHGLDQSKAWQARVRSMAGGNPSPAATVERVPTPPPPPPPPTGKTLVGLDVGGWTGEAAVKDYGACVRYMRSSAFNDDTHVDRLAKAGGTLVPLFGDSASTLAAMDTPAFYQSIVAWFKRYGKGGTFWAGRTDLGATLCEFVNEPGNPYFYTDYSNHSLYANMTKAAHAALREALPTPPKLLVSYDGGYNGSQYGREIFAAGAVADGVTVHPYGGHSERVHSAQGNRERVTQAHAETGLPVYVTEVGWPTGPSPTGDSYNWTEQQQAENITNWIAWCRSLGYVPLTVNFNYGDYGPKEWYGIVNSDASRHKIAYGALQKAASE